MTRGQITIIAAAAFFTVVLWLAVILYVTSLYLDCLPGDPEYGCLTAVQQALRAAASVLGAVLLTYLGWHGLSRAAVFNRRR
jgi:hypothetical protein